MKHIIPSLNWHLAIAKFVRSARPGDVIEVNSEAKAELARLAIARNRVTGVTVEVRDQAK